jgi:hypothetical protein
MWSGALTAHDVSMEWRRDGQAAPGERAVASAPSGSRTAAASRDWSRRVHRRACLQLVCHQRIEVSLSPPAAASPPTVDLILTRSQRAHTRLAWAERPARNARHDHGGRVTISLFGVPEGFATSFGRAPA